MSSVLMNHPWKSTYPCRPLEHSNSASPWNWVTERCCLICGPHDNIFTCFCHDMHAFSLQYSCLGNPMDRGVWQAQSIGPERVRRDQETNTHTHTHFKFSSLNTKDAAVYCYVWCSCTLHTLSCLPLKRHHGLAMVCAEPARGWPHTGP